MDNWPLMLTFIAEDNSEQGCRACFHQGRRPTVTQIWPRNFVGQRSTCTNSSADMQQLEFRGHASWKLCSQHSFLNTCSDWITVLKKISNIHLAFKRERCVEIHSTDYFNDRISCGYLRCKALQIWIVWWNYTSSDCHRSPLLLTLSGLHWAKENKILCRPGVLDLKFGMSTSAQWKH